MTSPFFDSTVLLVRAKCLLARFQLLERRRTTLKAHDLGVLFGLEVFVDTEEMLDLIEEVRRQVVDVAGTVPLWIMFEDGHELGVEPCFVPHEEDAEDANPGDASAKGRAWPQ